MAEIKVEKDHKGGRPWLWLLGALAVAGILAALLFNVFERDSREVAERAAPAAVVDGGDGLYNPSVPLNGVTYEGDRWVIRGETTDYPAEEMKLVGRSEEGLDLYANAEQGYMQGEQGGGGGEVTPGTEPMAYGRVFLKTVDGRFVPLFKESGLPE